MSVVQLAPIITTDYPYSKSTAERIDAIAKKKIQKEMSRLYKLAGMQVQLAPEIEFVTDPDQRYKFLTEILQYGNNFLEPFRYLISASVKPYTEPFRGMLELIFPKTDALSFVDGVKAYKSYIKRIARACGYSLDLFQNKYTVQDPGLHVNFSLWEAGENIFYNGDRAFKRSRGPIGLLTAFILNRFVEDIKDAVYLFACGKNSARRVYRNSNDTSDCFWSYCTNDDEHHAREGFKAVVLRDYDREDTARVEIRKFSDNSGLESLKTLFILRSVTDSITYLIKAFSDDLKKKPKTMTLREFFEKQIARTREPEIVKRKSFNPRRSDSDYRLSTIFPGRTAGSEQARLRFKQSRRMRQVFGKELHAMIA